MKDETIIISVIMIVLGAIEVVALVMGFDGQMFLTIVTAITNMGTAIIAYRYGRRKKLNHSPLETE